MFKKFNSLGMDEVIPYLMRPSTIKGWKFGKTKSLMLNSYRRSEFMFKMYVSAVFLPIINLGLLILIASGFFTGRFAEFDIEIIVLHIFAILFVVILDISRILQVPAFVFLIKYKKQNTVLQNNTSPGPVERIDS